MVAPVGCPELREWTARKHIELEYSPVYTPELNGVAERMMRTLMNTTRAKLFHAKLPKSFWSSAILSSAYVRNLIGPQGLERTPHDCSSWRCSRVSEPGEVRTEHVCHEVRIRWRCHCLRHHVLHIRPGG